MTKGAIAASVLGAAVLSVALYAALANPPFWIEGKIRKSMKHYAFDADALKFDELEYSKKNKEYVCGYVAGKNQFGSYVGFKRFAYSTKYDSYLLEGHPLSMPSEMQVSGCFSGV